MHFFIKLILFIWIFTILFSCDNKVVISNETRDIVYKDSSTYNRYYKAANEIVLVNNYYKVELYKNSIFVTDTNYFHSTLFFKDSNSIDWIFAEFSEELNNTFFPVIKYRPNNGDSVIVENNDIQYLIEINNSFNKTIIEYDSILNIIQPSGLLDSLQSANIDSLNNGNWYRDFDEWRAGIKIYYEYL